MCSEFKKLQRLLERKRHFKIELYDYSMLVTWNEMSEVAFHLIGTNGFQMSLQGRALKIFYFGLALSWNLNLKISRKQFQRNACCG